MDTPQPPLRILAIVNIPWDPRLGAPRVWTELAEQWRADGHTVEKFGLSDAFPGIGASSTFGFPIRQLLFVRKVAAYIRKHGHRFDVIDSLIGTIPFTKEELGFDGIIVARSVGLYLLYDRTERALEKRWPRLARGKWVGRLHYSFTNRRLYRASERALRRADLINVPNQEEAECLRAEFGAAHRVLVQPYGMTEARQRALADCAASPEARLAQKRVCFLGMWSLRKGSRDWAQIIRHIRVRIPDAQFRFLGTMVDAETIRRDLGSEASASIEFISDFQPEELPALLADCTVGAFPSYVEGFGLAVIEQLAAGIPVIAYDVAGPRDVLRGTQPDALVPSGATEEFAAALCRIMSLDLRAYQQRSRESVALASAYSWPQIARDTLQAYREVQANARGPIVFVQPFSVGAAGGGPRILRALLEQAPIPWRSICSSPQKPKPWPNEINVRSRPFWGRIEHSRLASLPQSSTAFFAASFRRRLKRTCLELGARAIHVVPHSGLDFVEAQTVARELSLPLFVSLHDDLAYTAFDRVAPEKLEAAMQRAWEEAAARFVISDALGREYCRRYGAREFQVVTDGVSKLAPNRAVADPKRLRIYFMGLFHRGYERNLRALLEAIAIFERAHPGTAVSVTLRCEHVRPQVLAGVKPVAILPFADEAQVQRDLEQADLLYMPLPFGEQHEGFARYSLSTKMVTYVGSGVPILYHGPETSAAFHLLTKHNAALTASTLVPEEIAACLGELDGEKRSVVAGNALELARREFMLVDQRRKFWNGMAACLTSL